jgi:hypothetical protein
MTNSGVSAGTYTLSTIIVDAQGIITSASNGTTSSGSVANVATNYPLTNSVSSGTYTIGMTNSGVSAGTYTLSTIIVDAQGIITSASNGTSSGSVANVVTTLGLTNSVNSGTYTIGLVSRSTLQAGGLSVPSISSFTWTNQGGSTAVNITNGPMELTFPPTSGDQLRYFYSSIPASEPWTTTLQMAFMQPGSNYHWIGLGLSDGTKIISFNIYDIGGTPAIYVQRWNSTTSFNAIVYNVQFQFTTPTIFLRINDDATNFHYQLSINGVHWTTIYSESKTAFLTATTVGILADNDTTNDWEITCDVWGWEAVIGNGTILSY